MTPSDAVPLSSSPNAATAVVLDGAASPFWAELSEAEASDRERLLFAARLVQTTLGAESLVRSLRVAVAVHRLSLGHACTHAALLREVALAGALETSVLDELGAEVSGLIAGLTRLGSLHWEQLETENLESLRKMFLAMVNDVRVALVELCARVEELREIGREPADRRSSTARTALDIFAPLASRLGIWQLKRELEDRAFAELEPLVFAEIAAKVQALPAAHTDFVAGVLETLRSAIANAGFEGTLSGRQKHLYSIYKKMLRKGVGFDEVYDVSAVRIIVPRLEDCYAALGVVHGLWAPISGEFDDYIAKPKDNYYRSLHTAVEGPGGRPVEVQIRTREMHDFAEYGIAAHWKYKEGRRAARAFDEKINWLRQIIDWQKDVTHPKELVEALKTDIFQDQIYVLTPRGEVIDLPAGATALDFAYRIHTELGHRCKGAKVGGHIVTLDRPLATGERVEILTRKHAEPSRDWLNANLGYLATASARHKVRHFFRQRDREVSIHEGREIFEREAKRLGSEARRPESLAQAFDFTTVDDFFAALGYGDLSAHQLASKSLELEKKSSRSTDAPELITASPERASPSRPSVAVGGVEDVLSQPAKCCRPVPGDRVLGYITRGRGLTIHRSDCPNMRRPPEPERVVPLDWAPTQVRDRYTVTLHVESIDRHGVLRDVAAAISSDGIDLTSVDLRTDSKTGRAHVSATIRLHDAAQLGRVISRIERLPDVLDVRRHRG